MTKHDRVQVDSILIDQTKFGEALRQIRAGDFDLSSRLGLQLVDRTYEIIRDHPGVLGAVVRESYPAKRDRIKTDIRGHAMEPWAQRCAVLHAVAVA